MAHNVDFHAVTGLHGGGHATSAMPGETKGFTFKALKPGLYVYHCATPSVAHHISSGMYGMILVEPEGGLPKVDHEFYVMQGEIYTAEPIGTQGELSEDYEALINEQPTHMVFNGKVGALTADKPLTAKVSVALHSSLEASAALRSCLPFRVHRRRPRGRPQGVRQQQEADPVHSADPRR